MKEGFFDPGDYAWIRGSFADAGPADKARAAELKAYHAACFAAEGRRVAVALRAMGMIAAKLPPSSYGDRTCGDTTTPSLGERGYASWPAFQAALAEATPISRTFVYAANVVAEAGGPRDATLAENLRARPIGEQMFRRASNWEGAVASGAPAVSPLAAKLVEYLIGREIGVRDRENTEWLKGVIAREGWPKLSAVGKPASKSAWLLAQHADQDPVFQLSVLRLMEPLVATGEVDKGDYAYLHDRVMLKIAGTQRYATQFWCENGRFAPQPLENAAGVEARRAEMGLGTIAEYRKMFGEMGVSGTC